MKAWWKKLSCLAGIGFAFSLLFSMGAFAESGTKVIQTDNFESFSKATADLKQTNGASAKEMYEDTSPYATMRLIVKSKGPALDLSGYGAKTVVKGPDGYYIMQFNTKKETESCYRSLLGNPNVKYVEPDGITSLNDVTASEEMELSSIDDVDSVEEPENSSDAYSWGVAKVEADKYASYLKSLNKTQTMNVAVVDSGVWRSHSMLSGRVYSNIGYDYVENDSYPFNDGHGHGTHVAGTIVDCTPGLNVKIIAVRVLDDAGYGSHSDVGNGIRYAADKGAKVINLSLGGGHSFYKDDAIEYAISKGAVVVAAAGNDSMSIGSYCPAHITECITVSAIDSSGSLAWYSNYGSAVDVAAPGSDILSCGISGYNSYVYMSGTSMASPHVSAIAAMYRLMYPTAGPAKIQELVKRYTTDVGSSGKDDYYGYGIPKLSKAMSVKVDKTSLGTATASGTSEVRLTWKKVSGAAGYYVYRKVPGGSWARIKTISSGSTTAYRDTNLQPGTKYIYTVRAYKKVGSKVYLGDYNTTGISAITGLSTPVLKSAASVDYNSIRVNWTPVKNAMGYRIYRRTSTNGSWQRIGRVTKQSSSSFVDNTAVTGTKYYYTVRATCTYGNTMKMSGYNTTGVTGKAVLGTPKFTNYGVVAGKGVQLKWNKVPGATGYVIGRSTSSGGTYTKVGAPSGSTTSLIDKNAGKYRYVYYRIRAYRKVNGKNVFGGFSPVISVYSYYNAVETTDYLNTKSVDLVNDAMVLTSKLEGMRSGYNREYPDLYETGENISVGVNENGAEYRVEVQNNGNAGLSMYGLRIGDDSVTVTRVLKENGFKAVSGQPYDYMRSDGTKLTITLKNGQLAAFGYYF